MTSIPLLLRHFLACVGDGGVAVRSKRMSRGFSERSPMSRMRGVSVATPPGTLTTRPVKAEKLAAWDVSRHGYWDFPIAAGLSEPAN